MKTKILKLLALSIVPALSQCAAHAADAEARGFEKLGAMIDVSRGRVLTVPYLKTTFEHMGKMGYNAVMLYTEDTYKLEGVPKWGYMRGGYTKDDIRELKAAADANGLEFVPCIETLGHLEKYLRWPDSAGVKCNRSTLIVGEPKTYELIDKMVAFWQDVVGGSRIHIGMDEAWGFWEGEYQKRNGRRPKFDIFLEHLQKVCEICNRRGFTDIMIWSDMFYRMGSKKGKYYDIDATPSPERPPRYMPASTPPATWWPGRTSTSSLPRWWASAGSGLRFPPSGPERTSPSRTRRRSSPPAPSSWRRPAGTA